MPTITATVYPNEAYVLVQADWSGTLFRQTFETASASNWPTADTGQTFTVRSGAAGDFTSSGGTGFISHAAANTLKRISVNGLSMVDFDSTGVFTNSVIPTGNNFEIGFAGRWVDANNFVETRVFLTPAGTASFSIRQVIAGAETNGGFPALPGIPAAGVYRWRIVGIGATLYFRLWMDGTAEPTNWNGSFTTTWLTAGTVAYTTNVTAGVTNAMPVVFGFDDLVVVDPNAVTADYAIVTRRNTVTGEIVTLRPYIAYNADGALLLECGLGLWWDTEPPLDVPLEYCTMAVGIPTLLSQNATFESGVSGWTATGATFVQDCTVAKVGLCSGSFTPTGAVSEPKITQTGFSLVANQETTISAWVRSSTGWNAVRLVLSIVYSDFTVETISTPVEILDDLEWRYLSTTFIPRLSTSSVSLSFVALGTPPNTNVFHIDDIGVTYQVDSTQTACVTVTVPGNDNLWLKNPLHPCLDVLVGLCNPMVQDCDEDSRVSYAGMSDISYFANTMVLQPTNRRRPLPVNRIRRDVEEILRLIAHDCDARDAILAANEPGDPLLWQSPPEYCMPDRYITVGTVSETHISVDQREPFRLMTLPHAAVDRPEGPADGVCGARIRDLCDIYTSWGALTIADFSWTELLLGEASPDGPGQVAPPAAARTWDDVNTEFTDWTAVDAGGTRDWNELRDGL